MNSLQLFTENLPELEVLPENPKIFWYPSAGLDFRGPVAFTQFRVDHEHRYHGRHFSKPDIFIYNSLGEEVLDLKERLSEGAEVIIRRDNNTTLIASNYKALLLNEDINFEINPDFFDKDNIPVNTAQLGEAFYFEIEVFGCEYYEIQKVLYFYCENIDFFEKIILKNFFKVEYLCTTQEGLAWGGCKKSLIDYIFRETQFTNLNKIGFMPKFFILSTDFTSDIFENALENMETLDFRKDYGYYINREDFKKDAIIYKLNYGVKNKEKNQLLISNIK